MRSSQLGGEQPTQEERPEEPTCAHQGDSATATASVDDSVNIADATDDADRAVFLFFVDVAHVATDARDWDPDRPDDKPAPSLSRGEADSEDCAGGDDERGSTTAGQEEPTAGQRRLSLRVALRYATDVEGSAFSSEASDPLGSSKWNLRTLAREGSSVLKYLKEDIVGVSSPMM